MTKNLQRTPEQQEYRDNLAQKLKDFRSMGDTGRKLADTLLAREKNNSNYILAKYGKTKGGALALLEDHTNLHLLEDFPEKSLDQDVVDTIVKADHYVDSVFVLEHPTLFKKPIDIDKVIDKIIENKQGDVIVQYFGNLKSFIDSRASDSDRRYRNLIFKIFEKSKEIGLGDLRFTARKVLENIDKIDCLSANSGVDIGNWLAYNGSGDIVVEYIDIFRKFYEKDGKDIASELINWGGCLSIAKNIGLFKGWTIEKVMNELMEHHMEHYILENPELFGLKKEK